MKRFFLFTILMSLSLSLMSKSVWTLQTVPNTRLESDDIHVSDPDGYLSLEAVNSINASLSSIRDTADVFLVMLASIGNEHTKHFATELFNYWGIGDAATNNGVLLLFVEDQRALEFETGYGAELALTDARCEQIFTHSILPYFKAGDYENGLLSGVAAIVKVYQGSYQEPSNLKSNFQSSKKKQDINSKEWIGIILVILLVICVIWGAINDDGSSRGSSGGSSRSSSGGWSSHSSSSSSGGSFGGGRSGGGGYSGRW